MAKKKDQKIAADACEDNAMELKQALLFNALNESAELAEDQYLTPEHDSNEKSE
ncbi:MAG TPA: hypothetical protein PLZ08_13240 [Bacillota bacterium]|nr:hypothetical protein [Bacillota bacterium]HPO98905.1 hypothetical protein [Bacillota bacterium]